jgi:magnesium transporter
MSEMRFFKIGSRGALERLPAGAEPTLGGKDCYLWLDFFNPSADELKVLVDRLGIHPLSIEDCLDDDQIPKVDDLPNYTFILFNSFRYAARALTIDEIDLFVGKDFLVTVHRNTAGRPLFSKRLEEAIALDAANVRRGPDFLLHIVLDYIVDQKLIAIESLQEELDGAEEAILRAPERFSPADLLHLRRHLLMLRKSLFHEREVFVRICRKDSPFISDKAIYHFRDIYDHLARFFETTEICREMISSHMEIYLSLMNNRMTLLANQTNRVMRRLTLITTIFMPLTLLAGIGGMSEWSMMTGTENWRVSYPAFFAGITLLAVANYYLLRWIDRRTGDEQRRDPPRADDQEPAALAAATVIATAPPSDQAAPALAVAAQRQ